MKIFFQVGVVLTTILIGACDSQRDTTTDENINDSQSDIAVSLTVSSLDTWYPTVTVRIHNQSDKPYKLDDVGYDKDGIPLEIPVSYVVVQNGKAVEAIRWRNFGLKAENGELTDNVMAQQAVSVSHGLNLVPLPLNKGKAKLIAIVRVGGQAYQAKPLILTVPDPDAFEKRDRERFPDAQMAPRFVIAKTDAEFETASDGADVIFSGKIRYGMKPGMAGNKLIYIEESDPLRKKVSYFVLHKSEGGLFANRFALKRKSDGTYDLIAAQERVIELEPTKDSIHAK